MFAPQVFGFGTLGFYQSFGGKQTLTIPGLSGYIDTGLRTNESQLRFFVSTFVSPTIQASVYAYCDVAAHGGPKQRLVGFRLSTIF